MIKQISKFERLLRKKRIIHVTFKLIVKRIEKQTAQIFTFNSIGSLISDKTNNYIPLFDLILAKSAFDWFKKSLMTLVKTSFVPLIIIFHSVMSRLPRAHTTLIAVNEHNVVILFYDSDSIIIIVFKTNLDVKQNRKTLEIS